MEIRGVARHGREWDKLVLSEPVVSARQLWAEQSELHKEPGSEILREHAGQATK